MPRSPRVFNIPASQPFLPTLVAALADGRLVPESVPAGDPLAFARVTLYLPTRRACRLARDVFLDVLDTEAAVLPRIVALGDIDEDEIAFADVATGGAADAALDLPPALGGLARRMLLSRLILTWAQRLEPRQPDEMPLIVPNPAAALALADDLAHLMDDMTTRGVAWDRLDGLVPDHVDQYWQLTLQFLKVAREEWPKILAAYGAIEPAARRDLLIATEAARLAAATDGPVIAAGSTGSMPSTARLLATIAHLPDGAVVLPGLDTELDEPSWTLVGKRDDGLAPPAGHPQFAMRGLLERIGIARAEVTQLAAPAPHGRERLVSEALRPADATERWHEFLGDPALASNLYGSLAGLSVIEATNAEEEALAIAVALREAIEVDGTTAALVTPDRALARRVVAALGRWNIAADDSGGDALPNTALGVFARLAAQAALERLAPAALLALIKHPLFRLGGGAHEHTAAIAALERAVLRGPRPRPGSAALAHALASFRGELDKVRRGEPSDLHPADPRGRVADADLAAATQLVERLAAALAPLERLDPRKAIGFGTLAAHHRAVIAALGSGSDGDVSVFAQPAGAALATAFDDIAAQAETADIAMAPVDYVEFFQAIIAERVVRRPGTPGSRVAIYGPLEARLTNPDRIVLGALNEGTWPPEARADAWLSRPMRHQLGLDLPERRIGLSAHDFAQMLGAPDVVLARAAKLAGAPTVASRFLQRLAAVAGPRWTAVTARGERYLAWARSLDRPVRVRPVARPEPRPPRAARPTTLSVTEIEHWLRDPYTIYARHVLGLDHLDPVDAAPGAAERGSAIHGAIGEFTQRFADRLPDDPVAELLRIGQGHFAPLDDYPETRAFWWPRFERIARWFVAWEAGRRTGASPIHAEQRGEISIPLGERSFRLLARADRIERLADGRYAILDYKSGQVPTSKQVRAGIAPQLTLEAAILRSGGFKDVAAGASVNELVYVRLKGGERGGEPCVVDLKDRSVDGAADHALARLRELVTHFDDERTPYRSLVMSMWKNRYGAYDDLARVKEWSRGSDAEDEFE